jgi:hypothetical protein
MLSDDQHYKKERINFKDAQVLNRIQAILYLLLKPSFEFTHYRVGYIQEATGEKPTLSLNTLSCQ